MISENLVHLGLVFPKETVKKIDERKGKYYSRNKYILKVLEEHLDENGNNNELIRNVQDAPSKVSSPEERQAASTSQSVRSSDKSVSNPWEVTEAVNR